MTRHTLDEERKAQPRDNETVAQKMTRQPLNKDRVVNACNNETLSKKTQDKL